MTDYELLTVFQEFVNITWMIFATYVSIVFAFIVASHLVANQLTSRVVSLVITLYTLVAIWSIWGISTNAISIAATSGELRRSVLAGNSSLGWLPVLEMSDAMRAIVPVLITTLALVIYIGSIVFFFYQRGEKRITQENE